MLCQIIYAILFLLALPGCAYHHMQASSIPVRLGNKTVKIVKEDYGPGKIFVHLHANETTALKAARQVARLHGGQVITLQHEKTRDIAFDYQQRHYEFDPNRIFTRQGIIKTLQKHHCYHPEAVPVLENFSQELLKIIPKGKVVAVHNNNDYSLLDYLPKHSLFHEAVNLHYRRAVYYRNFYLVTRWNDFVRYRQLGFNVVRQSPHAKDDGSLSIALKQSQYINVEAGYDQLRPQIQMLKQA